MLKATSPRGHIPSGHSRLRPAEWLSTKQSGWSKSGKRKTQKDTSPPKSTNNCHSTIQVWLKWTASQNILTLLQTSMPTCARKGKLTGKSAKPPMRQNCNMLCTQTRAGSDTHVSHMHNNLIFGVGRVHGNMNTAPHGNLKQKIVSFDRQNNFARSEKTFDRK